MSNSPKIVGPQPGIAASYLGVDVPESPFLTEMRITRIEKGKYEGQEIEGALALVKPQDRVLELGAGLGIVGAVIARTARPDAMLSFEANPNLIPHIRTLYKMNELETRIELRNQVLLASPNRPDTIDFHLGNSYLGSSLVARGARQQRKITVETADFEDVRTKFKPTVLIMDIEGGELDLLQDADLTGIRAVVIEFHPNLYGPIGMRRCKNILRELGFTRIKDHSTRTVWACERDDVTIKRASVVTIGEQGPPKPGSPLASKLQRLGNAQIVPPTENGFVQDAGVFDENGEYCPQAALWRKGRPVTLRPKTVPEPEQTLAGKWLWGGVLWRHFGHFIVESTSRLWPLPQLLNEIEGVLFIPKRPRSKETILGFQRAFVDQLAPAARVEIAHVPTRVEHLIVPHQGFGLGQITAGSVPFRDAMAQHFARDIAPKGSKKLYISRSEINIKRGGIVAERMLDTWLADEGYEIFHPQKHDIPTQIARYKAAETVLSCEGSALHMFGMTARPDQKVGIVVRRKSPATEYIVRHLNGFTGVSPSTFDAIRQSWAPNGERRHKWVGELDMAKLQRQLAQKGFVASDGQAWVSPSEDQIRAELGPDFEMVSP